MKNIWSYYNFLKCWLVSKKIAIFHLLVISIFPLLKVGLGAMFEVFLWASWRSNNGSKAFTKSSHTQILKIWSWNQNFPPGSLEDGYVPEMKNFNVLPYRSFWGLYQICKLTFCQTYTENLQCTKLTYCQTFILPTFILPNIICANLQFTKINLCLLTICPNTWHYTLPSLTIPLHRLQFTNPNKRWQIAKLTYICL